MGQQQLLLLVLGIVLVGLAVVVGIQVFHEHQEKNRLETRMMTLTNVAARIQAWGQTPAPMGGGLTGNGIDWTRFRLEAIGLTGTQVNSINWQWGSAGAPQGCFLAFVNPSATDAGMDTRIHLHPLDDCVAESWRDNPALHLSGASLEDLNWFYPPF